MKSIIRSCLAAVMATAAMLSHAAEVRTWTSADGTKTFEGELQAYDPVAGVVTVMMANGQPARFSRDKLSKADITFLNEQGPIAPPASPSTGGKAHFAKVPDALPDPDGKEADMNNPVQVFILMGQWNMVGHGRKESLEYAVKTEGKYPYLIDGQGKWTVRKDVRNVFTMRKEILHNDWLSPDNRQAVGADLGIGHVLGHATNAPVMLLKSCESHSSLGFDLLPPNVKAHECQGRLQPGYRETYKTAGQGPKQAPGPGESYAGWIYDRDVAGIKSVLENLQTYYPGASGYEIAGFFWWHGDVDRLDPVQTERYEYNLVHLVKSLRNDFGVPNAPFVCATLPQTAKDAPADKTKQIFEAQMAVDGKTGKYPEFKGNVGTIYSYALRDSRMLGADESNSKTIMNVGEAMGREMVRLLRGGI